jgi:hypothetical protein
LSLLDGCCLRHWRGRSYSTRMSPYWLLEAYSRNGGRKFYSSILIMIILFRDKWTQLNLTTRSMPNRGFKSIGQGNLIFWALMHLLPLMPLRVQVFDLICYVNVKYMMHIQKMDKMQRSSSIFLFDCFVSQVKTLEHLQTSHRKFWSK